MPDLQLQRDEALFQRDQALEQRDESFFQRDRAIEGSNGFKALWEFEQKRADAAQKDAESKYSFLEFLGGVGIGAVAGGVISVGVWLIVNIYSK